MTINRLYAETTQRLETALAAVCADFRPSHYTKVLEGHMFLGDVGQVSRAVGLDVALSSCWWCAGGEGHMFLGNVGQVSRAVGLDVALLSCSSCAGGAGHMLLGNVGQVSVGTGQLG